MGIQDRDYYRAPRSNVSPLRSRNKRPSTARLALFWIAVMAITFAAFRFGPTVWRQAPAVVPAPVASPSARAVPQPTLPPSTTPTRPMPAEGRPSLPPKRAPIYRCGSHYSHDPCAGGRAIEGPIASGFDSRPSERLARLVAEGRSTDSDTATTVSQTGTTVGRDADAGSAATADRLRACRALAAEVAIIDRTARQPLSAPEQDRLRARRRHARDEQGALHC